MIGDHHQLPPVVKNMAFEKFSNMEQSLFTRYLNYLDLEYVSALFGIINGIRYSLVWFGLSTLNFLEGGFLVFFCLCALFNNASSAARQMLRLWH
jgi:hypothetical protein